MCISNEFVIMIFQLICSCIYFYHVILPIALYGCEIWGFENSQIVENLHNDFLRQITNLRKSTPIYMLHAELGRHPIQINVKSRMFGFWLSIVNGKESKLSKLMYSIMLKEHEKGSYNFKWICCINDILVAVGGPDLFKTGPVNNKNSVKMDFSRTLSDLYIQELNEKANVSSKGKQYILSKDNLKFENYLINVSKFYYSKIIKYRTGNHQLPVETGRWNDIPLNERKCKICTTNDIGDENHYLFTCDFLRVTENCI